MNDFWAQELVSGNATRLKFGGGGDLGRTFMRFHAEGFGTGPASAEAEGGRIETPAGSYRPPSTPWDLRCEIIVFTVKMMMMMMMLRIQSFRLK